MGFYNVFYRPSGGKWSRKNRVPEQTGQDRDYSTVVFSLRLDSDSMGSQSGPHALHISVKPTNYKALHSVFTFLRKSNKHPLSFWIERQGN